VADRAHILPPVPVRELLPLTASGDIGVVPLRRTEMNYLGDTNKLFEYLMVGMPAVGSDFPELRRAILDNPVGPVGAVFDPADPESLLAALRDVAEQLPVLKARARTVARDQFSWDREKEKLIALYRGLAGGGSGGQPATPDGRPGGKVLLTRP
jgi:glycosyltransferase involved in cell wall biosynthesis